MHNPPKAAFSIKDYRFTKVYIDLDKHDPAKTLDINFDTSGKLELQRRLRDAYAMPWHSVQSRTLCKGFTRAVA